MVDFSSLLPAGLPADPALLPTLLDLLPMGVIYYDPVVDATGTLTDLALAYLNPAAQRMTGMPAQPGTTYRQQFPTTDDNGAWDFHRRTWLSGQPQHFQFYYDADGFDAYFRVASQRLGEGLLAIFTDTQDEVRSQAELALLDSQARERAARAEAEHQQAELRAVFEQAPAAIALLQGPTHVVEFANTRMAQIWGRPLAQVVGQPHFTALPDLAGQGFEAVFDAVWRTGEPYYLQEQAVTINRAEALYQGYFNITYQPGYNGQGQRTGIIASAIEVTDQVRARQQVEQLNAELEARVQQRTQAAEQALALAEQQRQSLVELVEQAPAALCIVTGPDLVYETFNPLYAAMFGGRPQVGRPMGEVLPEVVNHPGFLALQKVYAEGCTIRHHEVLVPLARLSDGELENRYFDYTQQPRYTSQGQIDGVFVFAVEVTEQVLARQQAEQLQAERLAAAQRQAQARESFYQVFEQTPAAVSLLRGPTYRFEYVNPVYQQVFAGRQLMGRDFAEALPDAAAQGYLALLDGVYHTGETFFGAEVPFVTEQPDAPAYTTYFNFTYQVYRENGEIVGISTFALDVTEQVLARQMRENQRRELTTLFEQAPVGVCILDGPELVYSFANPAYQVILPGRELLGRSVLDVIPELRGTEVETLLRQVYTTGKVYQTQEHCIPLANPNGSGELENHYFTLVYQPRRDDDQRITGVLNLVVEVTEQVLARQQADAAAAELRLLTAYSPAFLFRTDTAGRLVYLNRQFFEWTGLDATRLGSLDEGWTAVHPGDLTVQQPGFADAIQAGEPWQSTPYRFRRHDGQYRWMLSRSQPLFGPEGQVLGHTGLTVEIHEQMELQQQLERTNVDLDNFIYTASHDLKAPITNIEGLLLALEHELPATARTGDVPLMLTMMQDATERFRRTINHLTDLSRLQKEHNPDADAVALAPVVEAVRLDLTPLLVHTQGQLTVTISEGLTVTFAEKNLRSVVYNLLSNAFKYHHPNRRPEVHLRSWLTDDYAVLEVQDNGLGLDLTQGQERLFAMFQRLHTHVEGTGVGLYMVKRILENAGGRIEVSSKLGQGSTFSVYFRR